jgi:tetratricopeptide (TPR) repeat protein
MTSIFLSYIREDADKARALAALLERAGHSVWWDRHIKGGAQYSAEIETALNAADKVIVLWSAKSVGSAWVRDEAAAGRDSGRLIPVTLDTTSPPLGFRQFQTVDLSAWKGRSPPANLQDLFDAVGGGEETAASPTPSPPAPTKAPTASPLSRIAPPALALLVLAAVGGWWWSSRAHADTPVVAIDSASDTVASKQAANDLAISLGDLQSAKSNSFDLVTGKQDADIILVVAASEDRTGARRDLSVLSGQDRSILWSTSFQQPAARADDLSQQLALTSDRALSCALDALSDDRDRITGSVLKQYIGGCLGLEGLYGNAQYNPELLALFENVVARAPHFKAAWAKLLSAESEIVIAPEPPPTLVAKLRRHIEQVEGLGMHMGEIEFAKASLLAPSDFLGRFALYDEGIRNDPDNPLLYRVRSERLTGVGRLADSLGDGGQALQLDPLSPAAQDNYLSALAYSGQVETAFAQLRKFERMWPNARNIQFARYRLDLRYGDPKEAIALYEEQKSGTARAAQVLFLKARIDPTPANIQRSIDAERAVYRQDPREIQGLIQALGQFGRKDEAIDELLHYTRPDMIGYNSETFFRPAMREIWRDPRSIAAAAHVGLLKYWVKSGKWPDFCADPTLPYDCKKEAAKYSV